VTKVPDGKRQQKARGGVQGTPGGEAVTVPDPVPVWPTASVNGSKVATIAICWPFAVSVQVGDAEHSNRLHLRNAEPAFGVAVTVNSVPVG
jgi:hypothetical protein